MMAGLLTCSQALNTFPRHSYSFEKKGAVAIVVEALSKGCSQQRDCPGLSPDSLLITAIRLASEPFVSSFYGAKILYYFDMTKEKSNFHSKIILISRNTMNKAD